MRAAILFALTLCCAYAHSQQKPTSGDYTKVKIAENGHKDSVIDNKPRLYNASLSEPCLKCVIRAVKRTDKIQPYIHSADSAKLVYEVDWYPSTNPGIKPEKNASGLLINVYKDSPKMRKTLAAYIYDNTSGQLQYINSTRGNQKENVKIDSLDRVNIRNACFWGVASHK